MADDDDKRGTRMGFREVSHPAPRGIERTLIDRAIEYLDPVRGAARLRERAKISAMTGAGGYVGASRSKRSLSAWTPGGHTANAAFLPDAQDLRDRSRDLARNSPLALGALNTVVTRVVGTGLALQPAIDPGQLGMTPERAAEWKRDVKSRWRAWAESTWCDSARTLNFYQQQALVLRATLEAGDVFALLRTKDDPMTPSPLALQLIEAERVANPRGERDRLPLAGGIRFDETGRPTAYHVLRAHPGDTGAKGEGDWIPVFGHVSGRRNILHVSDPSRPGQARGVPYLAPVMEPLKQLGRYTDAEVDAAVIASFFTVFMTSPDGEGPDPLMSAASGTTPDRDHRVGDSWNGQLSSGLMVELPKGHAIETANPGRPNIAFDQFVQAVLRQIGAALEIPFELLIKHFTSSYTAARAALLDFWLLVRRRREWMASMFCQPVYAEWLAIEVGQGRIAAPGFFASPLIRHALCAAEWIGDSMGVLDPQREASAIEKYLALGMTTLERECMKHDGSTWEDTHAQQVREHEARVAAGLIAPTSSTAPSPGAADRGDQHRMRADDGAASRIILPGSPRATDRAASRRALEEQLAEFEAQVRPYDISPAAIERDTTIRELRAAIAELHRGGDA